MGLLQLATLWRPNARLADLAQQIAQRCRPEVSQRVAEATAGMGEAERRGYLRSRSAAIIHREVDWAMLQDQRLRAADRTALVQLATEAVIQAVANEPLKLRAKRVA